MKIEYQRKSLEDQLTSLELSKRLKELGVKQDSYFYHVILGDERKLFNESNILSLDNMVYLSCNKKTAYEYDIVNDSYEKHVSIIEIYSAFSVAEHGGSLPPTITIGREKFWYSTGKVSKNDKFYREHEVSYVKSEECHHLERDNKEADARAKMRIYLLENGMIKND